MATVPRSQEVTDAVRDYIRTLNLVPTTTLAHASVIGDTSITIAAASASAAGFAEGGLLVWEDETEEELAIASMAGNVITLDFSGVGYTGLKAAHTVGAQLTTNLFRDDPGWWDAMLAKGWPAIYVMALDESARYVATRQHRSTVVVHVEYRLLLMRPGGSAINPAVYTLRQQRRARGDLELISNLLLENPHLVTENPRPGPHAEGIGDPQTGQAVIAKAWRRLDVDDSTPQFAAAMDVTVKARRSTF